MADTRKPVTERLAEAMEAEFATSLPVDRAGWVEAAHRITERVERDGGAAEEE